MSGEEEEAVIFVPNEAEEEELMQYQKFKIRPCQLYEVRARVSMCPYIIP